jgi:hypothetical protein
VYGRPIAYLASVGGLPSNYGNQTSLGVAPYTNNGRAVNERGFQLISAGYDGVFGGGGPLPGVGTPGGADDQANFSKAVLGAGLSP